MILRGFLCLSLAVLSAVVLAGCGGGGSEAPTSAPATAAAPTEAPTEVPTEAPPTAVPTDTPTPRPETSSYFTWGTGGVRPADTDDVDDIVKEVKGKNEGVLDGYGNEIGITILYDPTLVTKEEVMNILADMGHPVEASE